MAITRFFVHALAGFCLLACMCNSFHTTTKIALASRSEIAYYCNLQQGPQQHPAKMMTGNSCSMVLNFQSKTQKTMGRQGRGRRRGGRQEGGGTISVRAAGPGDFDALAAARNALRPRAEVEAAAARAQEREREAAARGAARRPSPVTTSFFGLFAKSQKASSALPTRAENTPWVKGLGKIKSIESGKEVCLVALEGPDEIVGSLDLAVKVPAAGGPPGEKPVVFVKNVMVNPEKRRRGIATRLLDEAVRYARRERRAGRLELTVLVGNAGALLLYESYGFKKMARPGDGTFLKRLTALGVEDILMFKDI